LVSGGLIVVTTGGLVDSGSIVVVVCVVGGSVVVGSNVVVGARGGSLEPRGSWATPVVGAVSDGSGAVVLDTDVVVTGFGDDFSDFGSTVVVVDVAADGGVFVVVAAVGVGEELNAIVGSGDVSVTPDAIAAAVVGTNGAGGAVDGDADAVGDAGEAVVTTPVDLVTAFADTIGSGSVHSRGEAGGVRVPVERDFGSTVDVETAASTTSPNRSGGRTSTGCSHSNVPNGAANDAVSATAAAPELMIAGTIGAPLMSGPRNGTLASGASKPAARVVRPRETRSIARTTAGSNCVPAFFVSSRRASASGRGFLYARAPVMTA
jgi:hypothetical protein